MPGEIYMQIIISSQKRCLNTLMPGVNADIPGRRESVIPNAFQWPDVVGDLHVILCTGL